MDKDDKYHTNINEVTQLVYDTDIYEKVKRISESKNYNVSQVFSEVVYAINIHYLFHLKEYTLAGKRNEYLIDRIAMELRYYDQN